MQFSASLYKSYPDETVFGDFLATYCTHTRTLLVTMPSLQCPSAGPLTNPVV